MGRGELPGTAATRQALLAAGAVVFAARGFREATVREICRRARANVAAVAYHFGGKAGLYSEVLAEGQQERRRKIQESAAMAHPARPAAQLAGFIRGMMSELLQDAPDSPHTQLMCREMIAPTEVLDRVVSESIRPTAEALERILEQMVGTSVSPARRRLMGLSIVSQILHYKHCHAVITRLYPELVIDASQVDLLANHVTEFSLAALRGLGALPTTRSSSERPPGGRKTSRQDLGRTAARPGKAMKP